MQAPPGSELELRFDADAHFNAQGHYYLARRLAPHVEKILLSAPARARTNRAIIRRVLGP